MNVLLCRTHAILVATNRFLRILRRVAMDGYWIGQVLERSAGRLRRF